MCSSTGSLDRQGHGLLFVAHTRSFAALGGIARRGIYDNMKTAVDKVKKGKGRVVNARFEAMCSHYLVDADFCNVASGWDKGVVEKNVQDSRRRVFLDASKERFATFAELNAWLAARVRALWQEMRHPEVGTWSWTSPGVVDISQPHAATWFSKASGLMPPRWVSILNTALFDRSARVVKQAIRLIEHSGEAIDRSLLEAAYERASSAPLRAVYVRAARLLAQWESLEVLLTWAGQAGAETFLVVTREIERWQRFQNRRFAALPDDARAALMARLTAVSAWRPSSVWEGIEDVLRPL